MHPANERRRYNVTTSLIGWLALVSQWDPSHYHVSESSFDGNYVLLPWSINEKLLTPAFAGAAIIDLDLL